MKRTSQFFRSPICCTIVALLTLGGFTSASAAVRFWGSTNTPTTAVDGSGNWTTAGIWRTLINGSVNATWNNGTPDSATFGGLTVSGVAGTVTISSSVTAAMPLNFNTTAAGSGYTIDSSGGGTLTISAAGGFIVCNNASGITTINVPLLGGTGVGFTKSGTSSLTLGGVNTYPGVTGVLQGTLTLNGATGSISDSSGVTFTDNLGAPASFNYDNVGAVGAIGETVAALTFNSGQGEVRSTRTADQDTALTFASVARTAGAAGNFTVTGVNSSVSGNRVVVTGLATGFIDQGLFQGGNNYAYYDSGGYIRAAVYDGSDATFVTSGGGTTIGSPTGSHVNLTGNVTAQTTESYATLRLEPALALTLGSGETLTLSRAGVVKQNGGGAAAITGGTALAVGSLDLVVRTDTSADLLTIDTPITGSGGVTKTGAGKLTLNGNNASLTGNTAVLAGILTLGHGSAAPGNFVVKRADGTAGGAALELNGASLSFSATSTLTMAGAGAGIPVSLNTGALRNVAGNNTWAGPIILGNSTTISSDADTLTITGGITGAQPLNINGAGNITIGTAIIATSANGITKLAGSTGVLTLTANNNFTGNLTIRDGTVSVPTINLTSANGPLGRGVFTLGTSSTTGTLRYTGGTASSARVITLVAGTGGGIVDVNNSAAVLTLTGIIPAGNSLGKAGPGTLVLQAANLYTGETTISAGVLRLDNASALGAGLLTINGGVLELKNPATMTRTLGTAAGNIRITGGTSGFNAQGAAAEVTLNNNAASTVTWGDANFNPTILVLNNASASATNINFNNILDLGGAASTDNRTISVDTSTASGAGILVGKVTGTGGIIKTGQGILRMNMNAACDYTGGTAVQQGTMTIINADNRLPVGTTVTLGNGVTSGKLALGTAASARAQTLAGLLTSGSGTTNAVVGQTTAANSALTLNVASGNNIFGGVLGGSLANENNLTLTKSGPGALTLTGVNTYLGNTTISQGTLALSGSGSVNASPNIIVAGGATFDVSAVSGGTYSLASGQTLKGNGGVNGTVIVTSSAIVAPGMSIGTIYFTNAPALSGTTSMEIDRGASPNADKLAVVSGGGTLFYGGTLTVVNTGAALLAGDTFDLFDGDSTATPPLTGSFILNLPALDSGLQWNTSQLTVDGTIRVELSCIPATASAGPNQTICAGSSTAGLGGSVGGGATGGTWTSSGTGTFSPDATTLNATYNPSPADVTAGTVTLTLTSTGQVSPCGPATAQVIVTINPAATASAGGNQAICDGSSTAGLGGVVGGGATGGTWTTSGTGTFSPNATTLNATYEPSPADITAGTVTLTLTSTGQLSPCAAATATVVVTINAATAISDQPTNLTVCANSPAVFTVSATGAGLTYQWQVSGDAGVTFTNISDTTTNASYTHLVTAPADNGNQYQVIVTGTCGSAVTSAPPAVLTIYTPTLSIVQADTNVVLSWTTACINYVLEGKGDVDPLTAWTPVTEPVIPVGDQNTVTVPIGSTNQFFRLNYP